MAQKEITEINNKLRLKLYGIMGYNFNDGYLQKPEKERRVTTYGQRKCIKCGKYDLKENMVDVYLNKRSYACKGCFQLIETRPHGI